MIIFQCDLCQKTIKDENKAISVGPGIHFGQNTLCEECGKPVYKFLVKSKLISKVIEKT